MRILYVIDSLHAGGAEQSLAMMCRPLTDRGIELSVATLTPGGVHASEVRSGGATLIEFETSSVRERVQAIREAVRTIEPDLVHTTLYDADLAGRLATRRSGIPVSTTWTTTRYDEDWSAPLPVWKAKTVQSGELLSSRQCPRVHAVSHTVARSMSASLRYPLDRVDVAHRGRDPLSLGRRTPDRYETLRRELGVRPDEQVILSVGRHERVKGHDVVIRAFAASGLGRTGARLLIAGRAGRRSAALGDLVKDLGVAPNVHFLGHRNDIADLMVAADVLASGSRREGLPGTLIEALAVEVPIVATDLEQVREVVGDTAQLVTVDDHTALGDALRRALSTDQTAATARGRQRFEELFTLDAAVDGLIEHWRRVASASESS